MRKSLILGILFISCNIMLQKYIDEKYNHENDNSQSRIWLWVGLIVGIFIMIVAMWWLAIHLQRRIQYMRNHFGGFIKRILIIAFIFFGVIFGGIWILNLGTRKKTKNREEETI